MLNLINFNNDEFGTVRGMLINDKPYVVGKDVAVALGYAKPNNAVNTKCKGDNLKRGIIDSLGREQQVRVISESDIYRLIFGSKLPSAEKFQDWVCEEVLPQIRKTGGYIPIKKEDDDLTILSKAFLISKKTIEQKDKIIDELRISSEEKDRLIKDTWNRRAKFGEEVSAKMAGKISGLSKRNKYLTNENLELFEENLLINNLIEDDNLLSSMTKFCDNHSFNPKDGFRIGRCIGIYEYKNNRHWLTDYAIENGLGIRKMNEYSGYETNYLTTKGRLAIIAGIKKGL